MARQPFMRRLTTTTATVCVLLTAPLSTEPSHALTTPNLTTVPDYGVASILVRDDFTREATSGWSVSSSGASYVSSAPQYASVSAGEGQLSLTPGRSVAMSPSAPSAADVSAKVTTRLTAMPSVGSGLFTRLRVRSSASGSYAATLRMGSGGKLSLHLQRNNAGLPATTLVPETLLPTVAQSSQSYTVELQAVSSAPVVVSARAWRTGDTPPPWQIAAQDSSAAAITGQGGFSLDGYLSSSSTALIARYDDLLVAKLAASTNTSPEPPPPPPPPPPSGSAGSAPVGSTAYQIPSGAVFVVPRGDQSGTGTLASPFGSLGVAAAKAGAGATIVMRGGTYRESVSLPTGKRLTIQSYPNEAVWLDGSAVVSGWQQSGSVWVKTDWTHLFDHRVSTSLNADESSRFIDPAWPMAGYPDQVWMGGTALRQVKSLSEVSAGEFFVDEVGKRLIIGSDPSGRTVEASVLTKALAVYTEGTVIRGIGMRRYANTFAYGGAVSLRVPRNVLENVVVTQNATTGIDSWAREQLLDRVTVTESGALGLGFHKADGLRVTNSRIAQNNIEHFKGAPVSGGMKVTRTRGARVTFSVFDANTTIGLWFDDSSYDVLIAGNTFARNGDNGLFFECGDTMLVVNNYFVANAKAGIKVQDASHVRAWNNLFSDNTLTVELEQDSRRSDDPQIPFVINDVQYYNNVFAYGTGTCPILVDSRGGKLSGLQLNLHFGGNAYHRRNSSTPSRFICWTSTSLTMQSFPNLDAFRTATGLDAQSVLYEGASILGSDMKLLPAIRSATTSVPYAVPDSVAVILKLPLGSRWLGPTGSMVT